MSFADEVGATLIERMRRGGYKSESAANPYAHTSVVRDRAIAARLNDLIIESHAESA